MEIDDLSKADRTRQLNDDFRRTFQGGRVMLTSGFTALPVDQRVRILTAIRDFEQFNQDDDPYHEHDFVAVEVDGHKVFAKIEYYDRDIRYGADDPSDPAHTTRVMTIMLADEY